jgi:hypothetical protein
MNETVSDGLSRRYLEALVNFCRKKILTCLITFVSSVITKCDLLL